MNKNFIKFGLALLAIIILAIGAGYYFSSGPEGESIDKAIVITGAQTFEEASRIINTHLKKQYGTDWEFGTESILNENDKVFYQMKIRLSDGSEKNVYFDVTEYASAEKTKQVIEPSTDNIKFSKNNGDSIDDAIVISGAQGERDGIHSEYLYLGEKYGVRDSDWKLELQSLLHEKEKQYDKMDIKLADGTKKTIYFDITEFFGKY